MQPFGRRIVTLVGRTDIGSGDDGDPPARARGLHEHVRPPAPAETGRQIGGCQAGKRRGKVEQDLARAEAKLGNANFVQNAPAEVVAQERERLEAFKRELAQLAEQHERVASLR